MKRQLTLAIAIYIALIAAPFAWVADLHAQANADMSGTWEVTYSPASGDVEWTMFVTQRGTTIIGNLVTEGGEFPVSGSVNGKAFTMTFTRPYTGEMVKFIFKGTVDGESLSGTAKLNNDPEVPLRGERTEK